MTATKPSWWNWFCNPEATTDEDDAEVARKIAINKTPEEQIETLRREVYAELQAKFESLKQEVLDTQKEHFEVLLDVWTAPESADSEYAPKKLSVISAQEVKETLLQLRDYGLTSGQIADAINAKLHLESQVSSSSVRSYWSSRTSPHNVAEFGLAAKQVLQEVRFNNPAEGLSFATPQEPTLDEPPPFPEPTGDYKKIRWILRRLYKRFTMVVIAKHINSGLKADDRQTHNVNTFSTLKNNTYQWVTEDGKYRPVLKEERLPPIIRLAYQLLPSAEQAQYDEMFGAPK